MAELPPLTLLLYGTNIILCVDFCLFMPMVMKWKSLVCANLLANLNVNNYETSALKFDANCNFFCIYADRLPHGEL